jgi:hypothetical protein
MAHPDDEHDENLARNDGESHSVVPHSEPIVGAPLELLHVTGACFGVPRHGLDQARPDCAVQGAQIPLRCRRQFDRQANPAHASSRSTPNSRAKSSRRTVRPSARSRRARSDARRSSSVSGSSSRGARRRAAKAGCSGAGAACGRVEGAATGRVCHRLIDAAKVLRSVAFHRVSAVPRDGIEPPARGFSSPAPRGVTLPRSGGLVRQSSLARSGRLRAAGRVPLVDGTEPPPFLTL